MKRVTRNLTIVWRAERLIAQRRFAVIRKQTAAVAFAGMIAVFGLAMLDVAAFFALRPSLGAPLAALVVALANFVLAGLLAHWASGLSAENEIAPVAEVRDIALEDLEAEAEDLASEVRRAADDVRRVARDPLGAFAPGLVSPLLSAVLKALKKG